MGRDPIEKDLPISGNRSTPTVRAEGSKEDIMVTGENIKIVIGTATCTNKTVASRYAT